MVGSVTRNVTLSVEPPYSDQQPVVSGSGNSSVAVGDTASLQCRVQSAAPPHIKWLKKQNPEAPSDIFTINVGEDRYRVIHTGEDIPVPGEGYLNKLIIHNAQEQDSGLYICFVTNSAGSFNYKPSYLRVYQPRSSVERQDWGPGSPAAESTSILVLVISLGIIVVLILVFIIVCVVKKSHKTSRAPDSPEVVRNLMAPSRSTQSSSTITTVASNKFDHPLPPPPSIWATSLHKSNTAELLSRDSSTLHKS